MIEELLRLGVITSSKSDVVSQVLLVVKKGTDKLRFCIDYRALNEATALGEAWPIPNIRELLVRLGSKRPKFFGVMDLTSGYHQAPLSKSARKWTAFTTAFGCFEWTRVPMGLKGAPSYFSRVMMENLKDLLMKAVEVYLDDFIVFGQDFDEFEDNLEQVFANFRRCGITLNPAKCRFGLQKVEYVGHTIDSEGLHFTRSKIDSILDFPKPRTKGAMKTFLGMVNHMHTHIKNLSQIEVPLVRLIGEGYTKTKKQHVLAWDAEAESAYESVKTAVDELPKLFFEDPSLPIFVQTDASHYGIGAYMFQLAPDGKHRPICFLSKTLSKEQRRWGIPDKEAYGIFFAVKRWNHLLRDRHFVLQTDHKNLAYINYEGTAKVRRWKMLLQEYDFEIEYIKGEDNPVADSFSRNCAVEEDFDSDLKQFEEEFEAEVNSDYHSFIEMEGSASYDYETMEELSLLGQLEPIPAAIRDAIRKVHNSFVGHMGVRRTEERLREAGTSMKYARGWIERFIAECPFCQKQSYKTTQKTTMPFTLAQTAVMQELHVDVIGPIDTDRWGYAHVLTVIDSFSRWIMTYPLATTESEDILRALIEHIGIFGAPQTLRTDNGSSLTSQQVRDVLALLGTEHKLTVAYSHQENGLVENANRKVIAHLRAMVFDASVRDNWSMLLPFAQRICNAEVVSSLGVRPVQLLFGNALDLDRAILKPNLQVSKHDHGDMSQYVTDLIGAQKSVIEYAKTIQTLKDSAHMSTGLGARLTDYGVGTLVTVSYPQNMTGKSKPPDKLLTQRKGPYEIVEQKGSTYTMRHVADNRIITRHISQLELFIYDPDSVDPMEVAAKDLKEFVVEEILDHNPKRHATKNKKTLEFFVKWQGYGEEANEWVPWKNLTNNSICHAYCMANGMMSLVAKQYR
jgi:transposase InsO family protein